MTDVPDPNRSAAPRVRGSASKRNEVVPARSVDLTGRERQLRAALQTMAQIAGRFARAARRTLPFMVRQRTRLVPQGVNIVNPIENDSQSIDGPSFEVILESDDLPAWASLTINTSALRLILEGSLGASTPGSGLLGTELTLAQRALVARVARSLAEDLASVIRDDVGIRLAIVSSHGRTSDEVSDSPESDGLRVDCLFENMAEDPKITVAVAVSALESISKQEEEELPSAGDPRMTEGVKEVPVEIVAELGRFKVGLRDLLTWRVGQVLRLSTAIDDPIVLRVAGITKFAARPVISRGQLSVEIRGRADD
jgi:flagellar motor switch protein FliM